MTKVEHLTAKAQVGLAIFYAMSFVAVLVLLITSPFELEQQSRDLLNNLFGGLLVLVTQQSGYFFARQRPEVDPTTPPEGSK